MYNNTLPVFCCNVCRGRRGRSLLTTSGPVANPGSSSVGGGRGGGGKDWRIDVLGPATKAATAASTSKDSAPSAVVWLNDIEVRRRGCERGREGGVHGRGRGGGGSFLCIHNKVIDRGPRHRFDCRDETDAPRANHCRPAVGARQYIYMYLFIFLVLA